MTKQRIIQVAGEKIVIPGSTRERFLTQPAPNIRCMESHSILLAGISQVSTGYYVERLPSKFHQILYCLSGKGFIHFNGKDHTIHPGEVFIAASQQRFTYKPVGRNWKFSWLHLADSQEWGVLFKTQIDIHKAQWERSVTGLMERYIEEVNTRHPDSQQALKLTVDLLSLYLKRELGTESPAVVEAREQLQTLWNKVHEDLPRNWNVDEMAASIGLCKTRLHRLCVKLHNTTPMQMVTTMRMERAAELLSFTNYTLAMIAGETGYDNPFSFSKAFKRYAGVSPKEFREKE